MYMCNTKKDCWIFRFAIPFLKDAVERNTIFNKLIESNNKFSEGKLIHIATLSIECLLKSILLLSFYDRFSDWEIKKWLKMKRNWHKLKSMLDKIQSRYDTWLNQQQKYLIKSWWNNWISYRYWIDAFFNFIQTEWINSDRLNVLKKEELNENIKNYDCVFNKLLNLCKKILDDEYWWLSFELIMKSTIQISDCQLWSMKDIYG